MDRIKDLEDIKNNSLSDNQKMIQADSFFESFSKLDNSVYTTGVLEVEVKELMGLAISIATRCDECVIYHLRRCLEIDTDKEKIIEAIKVGVVAGGSITYPQARLAFRFLSNLEVD